MMAPMPELQLKTNALLSDKIKKPDRTDTVSSGSVRLFILVRPRQGEAHNQKFLRAILGANGRKQRWLPSPVFAIS